MVPQVIRVHIDNIEIYMLWIVLQYEVNKLVDAYDKTTISQTCK